MEIQLLVLHRKEDFEGQLRPEVLAVVDEVTLEENPPWWPEEIAKQKAAVGDDAAAWAIVRATLDDEALMAALYPSGDLGVLSVQPVAEPAAEPEAGLR